MIIIVLQKHSSGPSRFVRKFSVRYFTNFSWLVGGLQISKYPCSLNNPFDDNTTIFVSITDKYFFYRKQIGKFLFIGIVRSISRIHHLSATTCYGRAAFFRHVSAASQSIKVGFSKLQTDLVCPKIFLRVTSAKTSYFVPLTRNLLPGRLPYIRVI